MCLGGKQPVAQKPTRPVQIVRVEDGRIKCDVEALQEVLESKNVLKLPVRIISMNGGARSGKSFLINYFTRQTNSGTGNSTEATAAHANGFEWHSGPRTVTSGIWIWSEPVITRNDDGQDVAVFIMDTQGLFNRGSSSRVSHALFWLSCMLSSKFIFNVKGELSLDVQQKVDMFCKLSTIHYQGGDNDYYKFNLPELVLAMRDWSHSKKYPYGHHHSSTDDNGLVEFFPSENNVMRYFMGLDFQTRLDAPSKLVDEKNMSGVNVWLLPFPGKSVAQNCDEPQPETEMEGEFVTVVKDFVQTELNTATSQPWTINGFEITGDNLLDHFFSLNRVLDGEYSSDLLTMTDYHTSWQMQLLTGKNVILYDEQINSTVFENGDIQDLYDEHQKLLKDFGDRINDYGEHVLREDLVLKLAKPLLSTLEQKFTDYLKMKFSPFEKKAIDRYNSDMLNIDLTELTFKNRISNLDKCKQRIEDYVDVATNAVKAHTFVADFLESLMAKLNLCYEKHKHIHLKLLTMMNIVSGDIIKNVQQNLSSEIDLDKYQAQGVALFQKETVLVQDVALVESYAVLFEKQLKNVLQSSLEQCKNAKCDFEKSVETMYGSDEKSSESTKKLVYENESLFNETFEMIGNENIVVKYTNMLTSELMSHKKLKHKVGECLEKFLKDVHHTEELSLQKSINGFHKIQDDFSKNEFQDSLTELTKACTEKFLIGETKNVNLDLHSDELQRLLQELCQCIKHLYEVHLNLITNFRPNVTYQQHYDDYSGLQQSQATFKIHNSKYSSEKLKDATATIKDKQLLHFQTEMLSNVLINLYSPNSPPHYPLPQTTVTPKPIRPRALR